MRRTILVIVFALLLPAPPRGIGDDGKGQKVTAPGSVSETTDQDPDRSGVQEASQPVLTRRDSRYRLRPGDTLELTFVFTPEFNQTVIVQADGYITVRGLGGIAAEGQTIPELTQALQVAYRGILHRPIITVDLKDFEKPYFIVDGEVGHPGKFDLRGNTTVAQAIAVAGGFKETAKHSQVLLFRRVSDDWAAVKKINLKQMLRTGNLSEDPRLRPGDMLFVPKNAISKIKPFVPVPGIGAYASLR